jgi:hypothetical protein
MPCASKVKVLASASVPWGGIFAIHGADSGCASRPDDQLAGKRKAAAR